jgi:hypothetical protein
MSSISIETRVLAMSLDYARSGLDSARQQQQQPAAADPAAAQTADVILELSAAAQALTSSS